MLTPVIAPPIAIHQEPAAPATSSRTASAPQSQKPGTPSSNLPKLLPKDTGDGYGEDAKPLTFGGLLHRAIATEEEPAPIPIVRSIKAPAVEPKPVVKSRAIGGVLPSDVHQEKADPLPLVASLPVPMPVPVKLPELPQPTVRFENTGASTPERAPVPAAPTPLQEPAPTGAEAFSVRLSSAAPAVTPIAPKQQSPVPDTPRMPTSPVAPVSVGTEIAAVAASTAASTAPAPAFDIKPVAMHSSAPVTSIESVESPVPVTTPTTPVRDLALHLPGTNGVEVRMTERSGEVRVEVRTGDKEFTQDLRDNLRELVSGLERKGFAAEVSHPGETLLARADQASSSNDSPSDGRGGAFDRDQQQQQQRQPDQKFDGRSPKVRAAEWSETFNSTWKRDTNDDH